MYAVAIKGTNKIDGIFTSLKDAKAYCKYLTKTTPGYTVHEVSAIEVTLCIDPITTEVQ